MYKYIPLGTNDLQYGWKLSSAIWSAIRPFKQTTVYYTKPEIHLNTGEVHLPINPNEEKYVHVEADFEKLTSLLSNISSADKEEMLSKLERSRGHKIKLSEIIPSDVSLVDYLPEREDDKKV